MRRVLSLASLIQYMVIALACLLAATRTAKGMDVKSLPRHTVAVTVDNVGAAKVQLAFAGTPEMVKA